MNKLNSGSIETLKPGETLLVSAREVSGGKLHLEFAEVIKNANSGVNILSLLNKSDERFRSSARRAWVTAEPSDASEYFGVDFGPSASWETSQRGNMLYLDILNPSINGERCQVVINETTEATDWQSDNIEVAAKRKGKDGDYITHEGNYIFSNTTVMMTNEDTGNMHNVLTPDATTLKAEVQEVEQIADDMVL